MSLIVSEIYDALIEAGSSPEKAKAAASAMASAIPATEHLATKEDIAATKEDIAATKEELAKDIAKLDKKIAVLDKKVAVLNVAVFSFGPAILALLVKLTFFP